MDAQTVEFNVCERSDIRILIAYPKGCTQDWAAGEHVGELTADLIYALKLRIKLAAKWALEEDAQNA